MYLYIFTILSIFDLIALVLISSPLFTELCLWLALAARAFRFISFSIGRNVAYRLTAFVGVALFCLFYKPYFNLIFIFRIHVFKKWLEFYNYAAVQSYIHVGNCKNSFLRPFTIRVKKFLILTLSLALTEFTYVNSPGKEMERRLFH
jgi:hypothetical protein